VSKPANPTIVLLHGQPDFSGSMSGLRAALIERFGPRVRVLAPDRPGYGANPLPATGLAGNADWLEEFLDRANADPAVVVGHSWAGGPAAIAAARDRKRVAALVLIASIGPDCLLPIDSVLAAPVLGPLLAFATLRLGRGFVRRRTQSMLGRRVPSEDRPYVRTSGHAMLRRPLWRSFVIEQRAMVQELPALGDVLPDISVPTLLVSAAQDKIIPARTQDALQALIPDASHVELDGPHELHLRQAREVADAIAAFVSNLLGPGASPQPEAGS